MKSITQDLYDDKKILISAEGFFKQFHVVAMLRRANAYKSRGIASADVFKYLFLLVFSNRSMYMDMLLGNDAVTFAKDTAYRLMNSIHINWLKFTTILASCIIKDAIEPLTSANRENVLIVDDTLFERNRSKKVELLTKIYDHASHRFTLGFRMLTLGWSDGNTFLPLNSVLLSSINEKSRINGMHHIDKRSCGYRQRVLSMTKETEAMLILLETAKKCMIPARYVLFDSWFSSPSSLINVKSIGYDVIGMIKRTPKMTFGYEGRRRTLKEIYSMNKKRRGRSRYLLSVTVDVMANGETISAKVVYVKNKSNRKDYLCLISTDTELSEEEIIRLYGKRWDIEVFFKVCKSYLKLSRECNSLSYDAMTAHTAIVFARYMMLAVENRKARDYRCFGELFLMYCDEMNDLKWIEAFHLLMQLLHEAASDTLDLTEKELENLIFKFTDSLPTSLKIRLKIV